MLTEEMVRNEILLRTMDIEDLKTYINARIHIAVNEHYEEFKNPITRKV